MILMELMEQVRKHGQLLQEDQMALVLMFAKSLQEKALIFALFQELNPKLRISLPKSQRNAEMVTHHLRHFVLLQTSVNFSLLNLTKKQLVHSWLTWM